MAKKRGESFLRFFLRTTLDGGLPKTPGNPVAIHRVPFFGRDGNDFQKIFRSQKGGLESLPCDMILLKPRFFAPTKIVDSSVLYTWSQFLGFIHHWCNERVKTTSQLYQCGPPKSGNCLVSCCSIFAGNFFSWRLCKICLKIPWYQETLQELYPAYCPFYPGISNQSVMRPH